MRVGKNFPKNPIPECVIRMNEKHSYRKVYLTKEKLRVFNAQIPYG